MEHTELNPYRPAPVRGFSVDSVRSYGSIPLAFFSVLYTLAFLALIVFLFRSPTGDRSSAVMLLCNVPFLLSLIFAATRNIQLATYLALAAFVTQLGIAVGMSYANVGDQRRIAEVNLVIAAPLVAVAVWSRLVARRRAKSIPGDGQISG